MPRTPVKAALLAAALVAAMPAGASAKLRVSAEPPLFPSFRPAVHDYVSRCGPSDPLRLRVTPSGGTVSVDGGRRRHGRFTATPRLDAGQQAVVSSRRKGRTSTYHVRCLSPKFPHWKVERHGRPEAAFYLTTPTASRFVAIFDTNGVPIWWTRASHDTYDAKLLPNGHVLWSRHHKDDPMGWRKMQAYEEHTLTGRRVRLIRAVGMPTDHHDMQRLPNGNWLAISYRPRKHVDLRPYGGPQDATVADGVIQEVTSRGRVKWQWSSRNHISIREQGPLQPPLHLADGRVVYDLVHLNAVEPHAGGKRLLISTRATSAIYDIDRASKKILWKLGGSHRAESLTALGDPYAGPNLFGGQHDVRMLPDGTVTVYDNATGRSHPPRAVRYRINEKLRTATLLEDIRDPMITKSNFAGGARRMPGGHWAVSWGGTPVIDELTASGRVVFRLQFRPQWFAYRVFPILPGVLTKKKLRHAMDVQFRR